MKRKLKGFIFSVLLLSLYNIQLSSYALTEKVSSNVIAEKGSVTIMSRPDNYILEDNGNYYFKIENLKISIYNFEKIFPTPINELTLTDNTLKNSTFRNMFFIKNKLILIYETLNKDFIPYFNNTVSSKNNNFKDTFKQSTLPDKTSKKTFDSRGISILFYDISDIKNIKFQNKLYIHGDYETIVQKDDILYVLTSVDTNGMNYSLNYINSDLTDIINIDNAKSKRVHNLNKIDLIEKKIEKISSIKCDSIMEYLSNDSLYFINLNNTKSTIYRLSLNSDKLNYVNKYSADGYLTNPKYINEYNKKLTFIYQSVEDYKKYNLVLLDENLNLIKEIKNINNSEAITSVEFENNSVTMLIDTIHTKTIDFSTLSKPKMYENNDNLTSTNE